MSTEVANAVAATVQLMQIDRALLEADAAKVEQCIAMNERTFAKVRSVMQPDAVAFMEHVIAEQKMLLFFTLEYQTLRKTTPPKPQQFGKFATGFVVAEKPAAETAAATPEAKNP